jgi:glucose uptake protein GlcU
MFKKSKKHLIDNDMTYWEHFIFAFMFMIECLKMVLALIVHMIIPGVFTTYSSEKTFENAKMLEEMERK